MEICATKVGISGRENVMSKRELFCPDPRAGFEKLAGFQKFCCLIIKRFTLKQERTSNLSQKLQAVVISFS